MNYCFKIGYILVLFSFFLSCQRKVSALSDHYYKKGNIIFFTPGGNSVERGSKKMVVDIPSFSVIKSLYARDKNNVYFQGCPQLAIDAASFDLKNDIPLDAKNVYYFEGSNAVVADCSKTQLRAIPGANPRTYRALGEDSLYMAKDDRRYFYKHRPLDVDRRSFKILNRRFARDVNSLYLIEEATITRLPFEITNVNTLTDEYVLVNNEVLLCYDPMHNRGLIENVLHTADRIRVVDASVIAIDEAVIVKGKPFSFKDVNAQSFEMLTRANDYHFWSCDNKYVYYNQQLVPEADPTSFEVLYMAIGKDDKHVYIADEIFQDNVDVKSFQRIDRTKTLKYDFEDNQGNRYSYKYENKKAKLVPAK